MSAAIDYSAFLDDRMQANSLNGFRATFLPSQLFDFQKELVEWSVAQGRSAIFADCGMGKTLMQLVWAQNVVRHTNRPVLIATPIAVGAQTILEAAKFGIEARRTSDVTTPAIYVTNYERLHHFNASDFAGMVLDESSILKNFDGTIKARVTEFMRTLPYRLLCTATAAPNDFVELGTSAEALGVMGHIDMLNTFFKHVDSSTDLGRKWIGKGGSESKWRFKGHAETPFWKWVCSWARAVRQPSDLGYSDDAFQLPELIERDHVVRSIKPASGFLFALPAHGLKEQRDERKRTVQERCEKAASLVADTGESAVCWANLNAEADLMEEIIAGSVQVSGDDSDDEKEAKFTAFQRGEIRVLIIKPVIGAWGLNWQHCAHMTVFAGYSFEQYYQGVRRCWRFGQKRNVVVENVCSDGESEVLASRKRKAAQAAQMFRSLVAHMREGMSINRKPYGTKEVELPSWL